MYFQAFDGEFYCWGQSNEWGYTSKLLDLMAHMYEVDHQ